MTTAGMDAIGSSATAPSVFLLLLLLSGRLTSVALELGLCGSPLGMESGAIKDSAISASSAYDSSIVGPQHGRLRTDKNGGAWCPRQMVSKEAKEYLQIDLDELYVITGGRTQGRFGNGQGQEYTEEYMLDYWRPGFTKWVRWKNREDHQLLPGNTNTYTVVDQKIDPPIVASKIRFLPYSDHVRTVCMRVELVGCKWTDGLLSYTMPQGLRRGPELDLTDRTYDGVEKAGVLSGGLGQLADGQKGQDNFRLDLAGHGKGYEWVGWRNDTPGWAGRPLEILFEFDRVRNFSAVHLHSNNMFTKDVQVFSHAKIYFSIGGSSFNREPVSFSYMPDTALEHARNVTIKLHHRISRFVKLQLHFASRWILISEVSFDSVIITGNYTDFEEDVQLTPESGKEEYPLQRDEVKFATSNFNRSTVKVPLKNATNEETNHYIGFVIGMLTVVILILVAAIVFIVFRNQRIKASCGHSAVPRTNKRSENGIKMAEDCDKTVLYEQSCRNQYVPNMYPNSPDYTEVPDVVVCQEYSPSKPASSRALSKYCDEAPSLLNFLPKPPEIPPPPEDYFSTSEINSLPRMSSSPPLSPYSGRHSTANSHFMLPQSPEPNNYCSDPDDGVISIETFPCERLRIIEKLGEGCFEDVHLCEVADSADGKAVVVYTLKLESYRQSFCKEVRSLARLKNENVSQLLGACLDTQPFCAVREYEQNGDLCQFLQDHVAETATPILNTASTLSYGCLIYMATQIASGMKHLESLRYVHKDLATRNCLVGNRYHIKISDVGSYREMYRADYCQLDECRLLPLRWMAWESVLLNKLSTKSDVWSFAVVLWEILTFAREQPFEDFADEKVIENVTHFYQDNGKHILLNTPINCPKEIYDLMCECWQRNESDRPNFHEIHLFLQRKNLGYSPDLH